ncbi:alpha-1,4-N-acetylglucosaminyltransferase EXTL3 isoform 2 [Galdieria sulphuraria]|uniref:Alpha-1,4-N-acetylglucosaminyltransferase EXTL3 isoform 2 n=1 Tax=Galdieria sulphuraria TaxID=130081 RepID=M2W7K4_GALSU|nr:alpha-1,4-N-acetylglucosaminyltransferase EXTL3 isoform 2 [Galdieria sulphuraria]EME31801.1 alpha-1,4-N-acetylglucosaminyltransferase EXTL3 isoform 2 [Galdieria sulphuraria]|eukprot:XP_005708321.1 alpha-1,4-N-acetylglucosaminyltransferase EXTL3 isoform 2 [Galdieria sulphuraria]
MVFQDPIRRKKVRTYANLSIIFIGALLIATSKKYVTAKSSEVTHSSVERNTATGRYAYATLLCDDVMLPATRAWLQSLKMTNTSFPIVVLVLPQLSLEGREELEKLGSIVLDVTPLEYPFTLTKSRLRDNKPCRYSKLHLWNLLNYDKVVYMDSDMLVMQNIDNLFVEFDELSACADLYPDTFNSGIMVIQPNETTFRNMKAVYKNVSSYNVGDQGFLNWFFGNEWSQRKDRHIPLKYNVLLKYRDTIMWGHVKDDIKVLHFTGETKPWNFYYSGHKDWEKNSEMRSYYAWVRMERISKEILGKALSWEMSDRVKHLCEQEYERNLTPRFRIQNKFSVVISTYNRQKLLERLITHYSRCRKVHKIYVVWHSPNIEAPYDFRVGSVPVVFLSQKYDSLNNRFNPIPGLKTQVSVLICDDDVYVEPDDIDFTFEVWKSHPNSLVGAFPRFHRRTTSNEWEYLVAEPMKKFRTFRRYSIMLTKFIFMKSDFLFWYSCILPERFHKYIDEHMNCEDIAMQMMITGMTRTPPLAVVGKAIPEDYGTDKSTGGISTKSGHKEARNKCLTYFISELFHGKDPLIYNSVIQTRFVKIPFAKRSWNEGSLWMNSSGSKNSLKTSVHPRALNNN